MALEKIFNIFITGNNDMLSHFQQSKKPAEFDFVGIRPIKSVHYVNPYDTVDVQAKQLKNAQETVITLKSEYVLRIIKDQDDGLLIQLGSPQQHKWMRHPHYLYDKNIFLQFQWMFLSLQEAIPMSMILYKDSPSWFVIELFQREGEYNVTRDFVWSMFCKTHIPILNQWINYHMVQNATKYVVEFGHLTRVPT